MTNLVKKNEKSEKKDALDILHYMHNIYLGQFNPKIEIQYTSQGLSLALYSQF